MRTSWIVIATAVLGCLTGLGLTFWEVATVGDRFEASYVEEHSDDSNRTPIITGKAVIVGESVFDFGTLAQFQTGKCTFKVRNESSMPLEVDLQGVSCGLCIKTELAPDEVPSGDVFEFEVTYTTHKDGPEFSEYVEMRTSDPAHQVIRFNITGYVTQLIRFSKPVIAMGNVSAGEDFSTDFKIYCYADEPFEVLSHEFSSKTSADYFELDLTPLELDDFKKNEPRAKSAVQATLKLTQGKPIGPIDQHLHITAKIGDESTEAELGIHGTIVSDIVLIGPKEFSKSKSLLRVGSIRSAVGHTSSLRIRVHGPFSDDVKLTVGKIDPANALTATLGEPTIVKDSYLYPLTITIPKGAPTVNRLGSEQGKVGTINIETTHPSAKEVPIFVSFAVE